jgi:glutathione S-transferase
MLRVHGYADSLNVRKVLWLCAELGLDCERIERGTAACPASAPEYLARNPFGHVPLLEDGDFALAESNTILRYLARREGRSDLLPGDARGAAEIERWLDWQATDLNNAWRTAFVARYRNPGGNHDPALVAQSQRAFDAKARILDDQLARTGGHIARAAFTLADIPIGLSVRRWLAMESAVELSHLAAYYARLCARPAFTSFGGPGSPA